MIKALPVIIICKKCNALVRYSYPMNIGSEMHVGVRAKRADRCYNCLNNLMDPIPISEVIAIKRTYVILSEGKIKYFNRY